MTTWSATQAAAHLGVSYQTVHKLWRAGKVSGTQAGPFKPVRYDPASVAAHRVVRAARPVPAGPPYWEHWWSASRAGQHIGINGAAVRRLVHTGRLRGIQPGVRAHVRVDPEDTERYRVLRQAMRAYAARRRKAAGR